MCLSFVPTVLEVLERICVRGVSPSVLLFVCVCCMVRLFFQSLLFFFSQVSSRYNKLMGWDLVDLSHIRICYSSVEFGRRKMLVVRSYEQKKTGQKKTTTTKFTRKSKTRVIWYSLSSSTTVYIAYVSHYITWQQWSFCCGLPPNLWWNPGPAARSPNNFTESSSGNKPSSKCSKYVGQISRYRHTERGCFRTRVASLTLWQGSLLIYWLRMPLTSPNSSQSRVS